MIEEACFQITQKDIKPILAHPQRYQMIKDISAYKELKNKGFYFQLNALSLLGHYGPQVRQRAEKFLHEGLYDLIATDAHHVAHLEFLQSLNFLKNKDSNGRLLGPFNSMNFRIRKALSIPVPLYIFLG